MRTGETENHGRLKALARDWASEHAFACVAMEVRIPRSGFRADVAAAGAEAGARTAVFECKQSRADLLKDAHVEAATRRRLAELVARRDRLEALLKVHRPDLRCGDALWSEYDSWDFSPLEHRGYRRLLSEAGTLERRVREGTKFSRMTRYRCADFLYLVVEDGIYAEAEIPAGWGLLIRSGGGLRLARQPADHGASAAQRAALVRSIATARAKTPLPADGFSPRGPGPDLFAPGMHYDVTIVTS
jgi:hypothetical protein